MAVTRTLIEPAQEYDFLHEQERSRELQSYLDELAEELNRLSFGASVPGSLYSKRELFITPKVGIETI